MSASTDRDVVDRYVTALTSMDVEGREALIADDAMEEYPQSGERFRGRANLRAVIEQYPGRETMSQAVDDLVGSEDRWVMTPMFTVQKVAGGGEAYTVLGRVRYPNGEEWHLVQILRVRSGRISHLTTYFAPPFEPAEWREPFREPRN